LVVNKSDSPAAARTFTDMQTASRLRRRPGWAVAVVRTVATTGEGVAELVERIEEHRAEAGVGQRLRAQASTTGQGKTAAAIAVAPAAQASDDELFQAMQRWRA